jgi:hypothetical protein
MRSSISFPASHERDPTTTIALWTGLLAGPLSFLTLLEVNYVLSYVACETRSSWFLNVSTAIAVALTATAGVWSWRVGTRYATLSDQCIPVGPETRYNRTRWMAVAAALLAVSFIVAMIALAVPVFVLDPCQ